MFTLPLLTIAAMAAPVQQAAPDQAKPPEQAKPYAVPGEESVDPYVADNANAGATPFEGRDMAEAFHGKKGIHRIAEGFVGRNFDDPVIGVIFKPFDRVRITRTLFEQFCYILNAGCDYTGRDMASSHKDMGVQRADMNRLVENLQAAMKAEGVGFAAQNKFLSKLAPMRGDIVER